MSIASFLLAAYLLQLILMPGFIIHTHYRIYYGDFKDYDFLVASTLIPLLPPILFLAIEKPHFGWTFRRYQFHMSFLEVVADEVLRLRWKTPEDIIQKSRVTNPDLHRIDSLYEEIKKRKSAL